MEIIKSTKIIWKQKKNWKARTYKKEFEKEIDGIKWTNRRERNTKYLQENGQTERKEIRSTCKKTDKQTWKKYVAHIRKRTNRRERNTY